MYLPQLKIKGGFPDSSAGKESACNVGDLGLIPGLGRSPQEGKGYPLQYSGLENSMDCIVHGVTELDTTKQLSFSFSKIKRTRQNMGERVMVSSGKQNQCDFWNKALLWGNGRGYGDSGGTLVDKRSPVI